MRKQTKLVAVASAAALLAIGASMTSFAATGWVEESGEWFYYDKDGTKAEDTWKKSGDKWFWLDSENGGAMATDKVVEDGENTYYVDSTGAMVANTWVKVVNEEQDEEDDPAEYNYYYMQANGKAYKSGSNTNSTKFKTIDGKRYAFDDEGKMLYGWVDENGTRQTDESGWETATYYLGSWDDGAMKTGWQKVYVYDAKEDDNMDHWFNFKSNGKKRANTEDDSEITESKINGKKYGFDERGVMVYEWTLATTANQASPDSWKYFNSPEDGARVTKGWFKVIAPNEDNSFGKVIEGALDGKTFDKGKAEDETEKWYYADGNGELYAGAVKKIKGKYYAFSDTGYMLNGLVLMRVNNDGEVKVLDDSVDSDELSDLMDKDVYGDDKLEVPNDTDDKGYSLYYFGNDEDHDGAMKTGSVTVNLDGDTYSFMFRKSGGVESKGKGLTGVEDGKYIYKYGQRMKAGTDDKYIAVTVGYDADTGADVAGEEVTKVDLKAKRTEAASNYTNKDGETVKFSKDGWGPKKETATVDGEEVETIKEVTYLISTSGSIVKNKTAAKDGNDWYFYVDEKEIKLYANSKVLNPELDGDKLNQQGLDLSNWKDNFKVKKDQDPNKEK